MHNVLDKRFKLFNETAKNRISLRYVKKLLIRSLINTVTPSGALLRLPPDQRPDRAGVEHGVKSPIT